MFLFDEMVVAYDLERWRIGIMRANAGVSGDLKPIVLNSCSYELVNNVFLCHGNIFLNNLK